MADNTEERQRLREASLITIAGGAANALLAGGKIALGMWTRYLPMTASGFHSLSDIVSDIITWITLKLGSHGADQRFAFGYRRIETLMSLFAAFFLVFVGVELVMDAFGVGGHDHGAPAASVQPLDEHGHDGAGHAGAATDEHEPLQPVGGAGELLLAAAAIVSLAVKEVLFRVTRRTGVRLNSPMLIAKAWHHRADGASSAAVLLSVILSHYFPALTMIEQATTIIICGMILHSAWEVGITAVKELIDYGPSLKTVALIEEMAEKIPGVAFTHDIRIRTMGGALCVELTAELDPALPVSGACAITDNIRRAIMDHVPNVVAASVIISPKGDYVRRFMAAEQLPGRTAG